MAGGRNNTKLLEEYDSPFNGSFDDQFDGPTDRSTRKKSKSKDTKPSPKENLMKLKGLEDNRESLINFCSKLANADIEAMIKIDQGIIEILRIGLGEKFNKFENNPKLAEYFEKRQETQQEFNQETGTVQEEVSTAGIIDAEFEDIKHPEPVTEENNNRADFEQNEKTQTQNADIEAAATAEPEVSETEKQINFDEEHNKKQAEYDIWWNESLHELENIADPSGLGAYGVEEGLNDPEIEELRKESWGEITRDYQGMPSRYAYLDKNDVIKPNQAPNKSQDVGINPDEPINDQAKKGKKKSSFKDMLNNGKKKLKEYIKNSKIFAFLDKEDESELDVQAMLRSRAIYLKAQKKERELKQQQNQKTQPQKGFIHRKYRDVKGYLKQKQLSHKFDRFVEEQEGKEVKPELSMGFAGISSAAIYKIGETKDGQNEYMLIKGNLKKPQNIQHFNFVGNIDDLKNSDRGIEALNLKKFFTFITYPMVKEALNNNKTPDGKFDFGKVTVDSMNNPVLGNQKVNKEIAANFKHLKLNQAVKQNSQGKSDFGR